MSKTIHDNFEQFHKDNPKVYPNLCKMARELKAIGHKKCAMKMLWEVLRWQGMLNTTDANSHYRLNNNYTSRYARMIMDFNPDLAGFFNVREWGAS